MIRRAWVKKIKKSPTSLILRSKKSVQTTYLYHTNQRARTAPNKQALISKAKFIQRRHWHSWNQKIRTC